MSNEIVTIDLEEDLDYELEIDVEMDQRHEDALLNDNDGENEHENELVKKMSMTSVSTVEPPPTVTTSEPLPKPLYSNTNDFWGKSISTVMNVQTNGIMPTNEAVDPQNGLINHIDLIRQPVIEVVPPVQDIPNDKSRDAAESQKLETKSVEPNVDPTSPDQKGISLCYTTSSSSSSASVSSTTANSKRNRNKNKLRRFGNKNALHNGLVVPKHRIPSLMSIRTQMPFPRTRFPLLIPEIIQTQAARKKVPFIIKAQTSGTSTSRTVTVNPEFKGFQSRKVSNAITIHNANRQLSSTVNSFDLSNVVINKRRSTTSLESINNNDKRATEPTALPMLMDTAELSDEDRKYLMAIEEQKKKREEILRQKEWKRDNEGWQFLDD